MPWQLLTLHVSATFLAAMAASWLRLRRRSLTIETPGLTRYLLGVIVLFVVGRALTLVLFAFGLDLFGAAHLAYADGAFAAPLLGLVVLAHLARDWRREPANRHARLALGLGLLGSGALGLVARHVETRDLRLEQPEVRAGRLPAELRVGILADLQSERFASYEDEAISRLLAARPDIILIPGDLFQRTDDFGHREGQFERELPALRRGLARLQAPLGVYAVMGNTDTPRRLRLALEGSRVRWLHNELRVMDWKGGRIVLAGVGRRPSSAALKTIGTLGGYRGPHRLVMLLAHDPGMALELARAATPDLIVAGHTHGGQVRLPGVGALLTLSSLPARHAAGLHLVDGVPLYTSRGVGVERGQAPRIRFMCPPEITLLRVSPLARSP